MKKNCHFQLYNFIAENTFIDNPWCGACNAENNIGIFGPAEYEIDDRRFIKGFCRDCGATIVSELIDKTWDSKKKRKTIK